MAGVGGVLPYHWGHLNFRRGGSTALSLEAFEWQAWGRYCRNVTGSQAWGEYCRRVEEGFVARTAEVCPT